MGQLGSKMRHVAGGLAHWCPGCERMHTFALDGGAPWTWDGDVENPTFNPSMKITYRDPPTVVCHYFLHNGAIQYLGDCSHGLKNQRIILPPLPPHLRDGTDSR